MPITKRNLATCIILSIVTCGIYSLYWFIVVTDDAKNVSNDVSGASGGTALLLSIVTCGIYGLYWAYKQGERLDNARYMRGIPGGGNSNILFLVLQIFGLGIVNYIIMQDALNKISDYDQNMMNGGNGYNKGGFNNGGYNNGYNNNGDNNGSYNNGGFNNNGYNGNNNYNNNDPYNNGPSNQ